LECSHNASERTLERHVDVGEIAHVISVFADIANEEHEPDYRMSLAAERTYLAYLRTGLALMAAGVGVGVAAALPDAGAKPYRRVLGIGLVFGGGAVLVAAILILLL
jgi:uncharacterized membrane protein YidH (DUF202 family)